MAAALELMAEIVRAEPGLALPSSYLLLVWQLAWAKTKNIS
jgi:hypothetical protein